MVSAVSDIVGPGERAAGDTSPTGRVDEWLAAEDREAIIRPNNRIAYFKYFANVALYLGSLFLALSDFGLAANIAGAIVNGVSLAVFFIIGHDAVHNAFFEKRSENEILGRIAFGLCWHSVTLWKVVHNINHHSRTNYRRVDDVWRPMSYAEYKRLPLWRRALERIYRSPFGHLIYYELDFLFPKLILPLNSQTRPFWRRHIADSVFVIGFGMTVLAGVVVIGGWLAPSSSIFARAMFGAVIPFVIWNFLASLTIYVQHTHPDVHWFDDESRWSFYRGQIEGTVDVLVKFDVIPLYAEVLRHNAHHSYPKIPVYKLPAAQKRIVARYGRAVTQWSLGAAALLDVHRRCKLYDYEAQCWTDFSGKPTSGSWFDLHTEPGNPFRDRIKGDADAKIGSAA